ncbi:hypothetical protein [Thermococcus prieurii]
MLKKLQWENKAFLAGRVEIWDQGSPCSESRDKFVTLVIKNRTKRHDFENAKIDFQRHKNAVPSKISYKKPFSKEYRNLRVRGKENRLRAPRSP